jgi:polar amino acid transport system permease protein
MDWNWIFAAQTFYKLMMALPANIFAAALALALAMVVGLAFALMKRSSIPSLAAATGIAVGFIRRTPILVQLYFLFYVLPDMGILLSPLAAGVIGLGLHNSAYLCEVYLAGIAHVDKGQWDALTALNLTRAYAWRRVILPQAVPPMTPALGNYVLLIFKETALLSVITTHEIMLEAQMIASENYRYLEPMTLVGVIFLSICLPVAFALRLVEIRINRSDLSHAD